MEIRRFEEGDWREVWGILQRVFKEGDTFPNDPDTTEKEARNYWIEKPRYTFIAEDRGRIVGSYHIKDNQIGLGSHIANAGYVVHPDCRRLGIGQQLAQHSLEFAKANGYLAMQFNLVVATNLPSISLWRRLDFKVIGSIPKAFNHKTLGLVDACILYRWLA